MLFINGHAIWWCYYLMKSIEAETSKLKITAVNSTYLNSSKFTPLNYSTDAYKIVYLC